MMRFLTIFALLTLLCSTVRLNAQSIDYEVEAVTTTGALERFSATDAPSAAVFGDFLLLRGPNQNYLTDGTNEFAIAVDDFDDNFDRYVGRIDSLLIIAAGVSDDRMGTLNLETGAWTRIAGSGESIGDLTGPATVFDGIIYAIGREYGPNQSEGLVTLDPVSRQVTRVATLPEEIAFVMGGPLSIEGTVLYITAERNDGRNVTYAYTSGASTFQEVFVYPALDDFTSPPVFYTNGRDYLVEYGNGTPTSTLYIFRDGALTATIPVPGQVMTGMAPVAFADGYIVSSRTGRSYANAATETATDIPLVVYNNFIDVIDLTDDAGALLIQSSPDVASLYRLGHDLSTTLVGTVRSANSFFSLGAGLFPVDDLLVVSTFNNYRTREKTSTLFDLEANVSISLNEEEGYASLQGGNRFNDTYYYVAQDQDNETLLRYLVADPSTAINDAGRLKATVTTFPNPVADQLSISVDTGWELMGTLLSALGQELASFTMTGTYELDVSTFNAGTFYLRLRNPATGAAVVKKVIVQH